jgi:anti-sigma factor RsiW
MHEEWTDLLSDYLDGELTAGERVAVDAHLSGCADCRRVLEELQRVVGQARSIQSRPPQSDLWPGIAERIDARAEPASVAKFDAPPRRNASFRSRRISLSLAQLATAAALLMAVSGGMVWSIAGRRAPADDRAAAIERPVPPPAAETTAEPSERTPSDDVQVAAIGFADQQYDAAVADLEKALHKGRGHLDASTIAIVEHNLQLIDQAISQARQALTGDPANSYLSSHLVETRRRKLDLLRRAAALSGETN